MKSKKRSRVHVDIDARPPKRARPKSTTDQSASATPSTAPTPVSVVALSKPAPVSGTLLHHPVLQRLYPKVLSLRHYLLSRLPRSSKTRLRKLSQLGLPSSSSPSSPTNPAHPATHHHAAVDAAVTATATDDATSSRNAEIDLAYLLDHTLVGVSPPATQSLNHDQATRERIKDIESFTQQLSNCTTTALSASTLKPGYFQQHQIVDFVIWQLFKRSTSTNRPSHLLCRGFQRSNGPSRRNAAGVVNNDTNNHNPPHSTHGLVCVHPNSAVTTIKGPLWSRLHSLLGKDGDYVMMDLLIDCGIFTPINEHLGNYVQLSGPPVSELKQDHADPQEKPANTALLKPTTRKPSKLVSENRSPNTITFVRSRMLYARSALNAKGGVRFGLRHIHVLNRFPERSDELQTIHIMRYIFPRQFGHHNVFTSKVDVRETSMPFKDYTLREKDIHQHMCVQLAENVTNAEAQVEWKSRVPKRLRGNAVALVNKLRTLHHQCSYVELLRHYCPVEGLSLSPRPGWRKNTLHPPGEAVSAAVVSAEGCDKSTHIPESNDATAEERSFMDMACPTAHVSAFCRAVVAKVVPNAFWGDENNKRIIMYWIDQFVSLRRFESLTLHQVTQKIQITRLAWLQIPGTNISNKLARTDFDKRKEIFLELVYWLFDSFLVPLIRSNFHVTESNVHRNRLFYFRHDVWRKLTEPTLANLRLSMFEEMPQDRVARLFSVRSLGFSKIRLLPKRAGLRLIMNLKRRQQVMRNGSLTLSRSINTVMAPVFNAITYEKSLQPEKFGCSLFSVGDMLPKLTAFKQSLQEQGLKDKPLYFAKVDVQSCFDTIPQKRLVSMVDSLMSLKEYRTGKHVEISPLGKLQQLDGRHVNPMPFKRYVAHSGDASEMDSFGQLVRDKFVGAKTNTVFVNTAVQRVEAKDDLMGLLREHVERNVVKIGKRFYRQKTGIPQGSVLSTILCNFFYAELERDVLSFALGNESLLLRLLDDFCLITTNHEHAERFIRTMHRGHPDYGVTVRVAKSLTNFAVLTDDGNRVPQIISGDKFPYCGVLVDTHTLDVSKKSERGNVQDSLTVDLSKVPGQTFHRKALNGFKIQLQAMLIDTSLNSVTTVLANLYHSFHEAAVRCLEYCRTLSKVRAVHSRLLIKTVDGIIALGFVMLQRRSRSRARQNLERVRREVSRRQVKWLACQAFSDVFQGRQQKQHRGLRAWLEKSLAAVRPSQRSERCMLADAIAGHAQWLRK